MSYEYKKYKLLLVREESKIMERPYCAHQPSEIYQFLCDVVQMDQQSQEVFLVISVDVKGEIIGYSTVAIGGLHTIMLQIRDILKHAILCNAAAIIVAHNHPSGEPSPSNEDVQVTKNIQDAAELMDIPLLDHVIVGYGCYTSLREQGEIKSRNI